MRIPYYKSLDREFELFGIKGRWVKVVLAGAGVGLLLGLIVGSFAGTIIGVVIFIITTAILFFGCITIQTKVPSRQLPKMFISGKIRGWVIRSETSSRILLEDPMYYKVRECVERMKAQGTPAPVPSSEPAE